MAVLELIFWLSLFALVYAYVGYPFVLWVSCRLLGKEANCDTADSNRERSVSIIISAYNEERVIGGKIENTLSLDFQQELLEIIVVSDGSTDKTCEIVAGYANRGVVLRHFDERIGKTARLNAAVPQATGEIVVFSDANSTFDKGALAALLTPFQSDSVGFVTGWTCYGAHDGMPAMSSLGLYSRLELLTKELESTLGSCVGADGAIFAIRKSLYPPLNDYDINDFVIPLSINESGYRGVLRRDAICFEKDAGSHKGEFSRQVRITTRTIRALVNYRHLLNPLRFGWFSVALFSHKWCKFLVPVFLVALLFCNLFLAEQGALYCSALAVQVFLYSGAALGLVTSKTWIFARLLDAAKLFVLVNVAIALAWVKYAQGETFTTWSPTKR